MAKNTRHHLDPASDKGFTPKELTKQEFGRRLMKLMMDKKWNQSDLAREADMGRDAISTYIRGQSFPEPKNLHKLASVLGVTVEELLPNAIARAMDSDTAPMLEIRQAANHPGKVWIRVNRMVTFDQAADIFQVLKNSDNT